MRRTFLFSAVLFCMSLIPERLMAENTDISRMDYVIYVEPQTVKLGATECTLSVKMNNKEQAFGFSFTMALPEGFSFGEPATQLSTVRTDETHINKYDVNAVDNILKVNAYYDHKGDGLINGNDGEVALVHILLPKDITEGEYPIRIEEATVALDGRPSEPIDETITSTLTIDGGVTLDENETSFDVLKSAAGTDKDVTVKRTIKANQWSTIVLPFAMTGEQTVAAFGSDVQLAEFSGWAVTEKDENDEPTAITISCTELTATDGIAANHPYLVKTKQPVTEFTVDGVNIDATSAPTVTVGKGNMQGKLIGTYVAGTTIPEEKLFLSENKFWYSTGRTKIKAFRAYFDLKKVLIGYYDDAEARITMSFESNGTSGVSVVKSPVGDDKTYDLQGRRIGKPAKGIYVKNGKKVVVK